MPDVLLVDDDGASSFVLARALKAAGLDAAIHAVTTADQALSYFRSDPPAVAVLDLSIDPRRGVESGFQLLREIASRYPQSRAIVLTGHGDDEFGVKALQLGAASFVMKPVSAPHLAALIRDGIRYSELKRRSLRLEAETTSSALIGISDQIAQVREKVTFAARTAQAVFLSGETGTGKGVCAQLLHRLSSRSAGNFVRYQPSFVNADLVQSDLFGHRKGAFTGAAEERRGLIADAHRGTLFLDEIDELPAEFQITLLGVLQEKRFRPVGASAEELSDFRLVAASNRGIDAALAQGKLRPDLYHRMAQLVIELPPLRVRPSDIEPLAQHFLRTIAGRDELPLFGIGSEAGAKLVAYRWPGNVRELQSVVESAAYRAYYRGSTEIHAEDIELRGPSELSVDSPLRGFSARVEAFKLTIIEEALRRCGGNQAHAARELELDRSTLRRIMARSP